MSTLIDGRWYWVRTNRVSGFHPDEWVPARRLNGHWKDVADDVIAWELIREPYTAWHESPDRYRRVDDLTVDQARAILRHAPRRITPGGAHCRTKVEVRYEEHWLRLGRTDMAQQAATFCCSSDATTMIYDLDRRCAYGARIDGDALLILDSLTDG